MGCGVYLKELLRPLGLYRLEGSINGAELEAIGGQLDGVTAQLDDSQREMLVCTAEDFGLECIENLLRRVPAALDLAHRRAALAALLRVGDDSFTLSAINDNLAGCGLNAVVSETDEQGVVEVCFPEVPGVPDGFSDMAAIIEDIIPCHLLIRYIYWYITWELMEERFTIWGNIEATGLSWGELQKLVR